MVGKKIDCLRILDSGIVRAVRPGLGTMFKIEFSDISYQLNSLWILRVEDADWEIIVETKIHLNSSFVDRIDFEEKLKILENKKLLKIVFDDDGCVSEFLFEANLKLKVLSNTSQDIEDSSWSLSSPDRQVYIYGPNAKLIKGSLDLSRFDFDGRNLIG